MIQVLTQPIHDMVRGENIPAVHLLEPYNVLDHGIASTLPSLSSPRLYVPMSEYLFAVTREPLRDYLHADSDFQRAFDRFEYLSALVGADIESKYGRGFYIGRFGWRGRSYGWNVRREVADDMDREGENWAPIVAGAFGGEINRALAAQGSGREGREPTALVLRFVARRSASADITFAVLLLY